MFTVVLLLLFVGAIALLGVALSGAGARDRSHDAPPHLPGHDTQRRRREWEQKNPQ